jgi:hypothetical protein
MSDDKFVTKPDVDEVERRFGMIFFGLLPHAWPTAYFDLFGLSLIFLCLVKDLNNLTSKLSSTNLLLFFSFLSQYLNRETRPEIDF